MGLLGLAPGVAGGGVPSPVFGTQIAGTTGAGKCVKDVFVFGAELSGATVRFRSRASIWALNTIGTPAPFWKTT